MLVRHNTTLLEQAVDLAVKRSAIPTLQAQAAAQEKTARATAIRRMATGGAIAVAAVGIGLGIKLGLWDKTLPEPVALPTIEQPSDLTSPTDEPPIPVPTPKPTQEQAPQGVACLFNILDLLDQQLDAIKLAADLRYERWRQWTPICGNERVETSASIAFQRFVSGHTLAEQKALYPVDVPDRSFVRAFRSRTNRRQSSSSSVGTRNMAQTLGSPRL
ncbi:hypothetical protein X759_12165 [Mesorhizobium sp. LSHC420B00]|nr:hypothetical protein X759_12165 [Mesorhizobium sp. LSHC420B00]